MKLMLDARRRWWLLLGAWIVLMVLGITGFVQQSRDLGLERNVRDHLYFTLQLARLDYRGAPTEINWRLEVARFAAPALAVSTLLQSVSVVFREQIARWRVRFARDHTVVTGLGPAGVRLTAAMVAAGHRVVAIERDPVAPGVVAVRESKVPVVLGDPSDPTTLQAARVDRARRLVVAGPADGDNVAVATAAGRLPRDPTLPPLRCATHLSNAELAHLLRAADLTADRPVRIEFFNLHERAARVMVDEHPPPTDGRPHLVVLGLGQVGRSVVVAAAQQWADRGDGVLPVTMVDRAATGRFHALTWQHPALRGAVAARCIETDLTAPGPEVVAALQDAIDDRPPTLVVSVFEDQALAWSAGLLLKRMTRPGTPIVVRTESDGGLGTLLGQALAGADSVSTFPIFARACTVATIEGGVREQFARAMHEDHVARTGSGAALHRHWDDLDDLERESSRAAADAIVGRLETIGVELAPLRSWTDVEMPFTTDEIDALAADEHARWMAERSAGGWTWGEARDDAAMTNPLLRPWDELDEQVRNSNREAVRALPSLIARAGFELARRSATD